MELNDYIQASTQKDFSWSKFALVSLARDLTLPKAHSLKGLGPRERVVDNMLNEEACEALLQSIDLEDWLKSDISEQRRHDGFANMRTFSQEFSEELWLKAHHTMKPVMDFSGSELARQFDHDHWRPLGFLPIFNILRVQSGESVSGKIEKPEIEMRERIALMSLWIVLSRSMRTFQLESDNPGELVTLEAATGQGYLLEKMRKLHVPEVPNHQALVVLQTGVLFEKSRSL